MKFKFDEKMFEKVDRHTMAPKYWHTISSPMSLRIIPKSANHNKNRMLKCFKSIFDNSVDTRQNVYVEAACSVATLSLHNYILTLNNNVMKYVQQTT